jgi:2-methylisocitrate lyase-like PEP mutase family enzyme
VARSVGFPFVLTARAENFFLGRRDLDDTIRRLQAFEKAGADVLYAPGLKDLKSIRTVASSVTKPVNVVIGGIEPGITLQDLAQAGVKRVSVGGMLCRLALAHVASAAREMKEQGSFGWMAQAMPAGELRRMFT